MASPATRIGAVAAGLAAVWTFAASPAAAQSSGDQHAGVLSVQGTQDVAAPVAPAVPAPGATQSTPAVVDTPTSYALPVTGGDVVGLTGVGLGLVASGFALKRRFSS